jgi:hypothetical protein
MSQRYQRRRGERVRDWRMPTLLDNRWDQSGCDPDRRRPNTKYETGTTPAELTTATTAAHTHLGPRIWLAGRRLMSISAATLRRASVTAAAMSNLRLRSLSWLHCFLAAKTSSAHGRA